MRLGLAVRGILLGMAAALVASIPAQATEFHGQVTFGGLPVPGAQAVVTATQGDKTVSAVTNDQGLFIFPDLADGAWTLSISMTGFAPIKSAITVAPNSPIPVFELKIETLEQIRAEAKPIKVEPGAAAAVATASAPDAATSGGTGAAADAKKGKTQQAANTAGGNAAPAQEAASSAPEGFLVNGSVNNAATSQYSLAQAFGNTRNSRSLYTWGLSLVLNNSTLDAKPYSITGQNQPKPNFNNYTIGAQFQGPLKIPHLLPAFRAPNFQIQYSHTQNSTVDTRTATVPTGFTAGQDFDLSNVPNLAGKVVYAPSTGLRPGCAVTPGSPLQKIPAPCISPVAAALLNFYPAANVTNPTAYNYQIPLTTTTQIDGIQPRLSKSVTNKDYLNGYYYWQRSDITNPSIFTYNKANFVDTQKQTSQGVEASWQRRITQRLNANLTYDFTRSHSINTPFFENKQNISQSVGISDNLQDAANWGPPAVNFAGSGYQALYDGNSSNNRIQTQSIAVKANWNRFRHEMQFGGDFRRQEWNYFQQANPRGTVSFTGAATAGGVVGGGSDFADFLFGQPYSSQIAYGNADKYLRQSVYDLYANDNFRVSPELSVSFGLRWEYGAPITEAKNRLVNLDFSKNFAGDTTVLATNPTGTYSGQRYGNSLIHPDKNGFAPSIGIAWRPISGSSLLVRSGYSLTHDTGVYQSMALAMANQSPCPVLGVQCAAPWAVTSLNATGDYLHGCALALATPFETPGCGAATATPDTFAVDPDFRVGYVHTWNLSVQRDLPAALQMTATYTGTKGTRGKQEILPNTYGLGVADPCLGCPKNFYYLMSNGNLTREAGEVLLRRRLRAGLSASADYTFSKSIDDYYSYGGGSQINTGSSSGGQNQPAQDWRHPEAQRGLSNFDQRHLLKLSLQYTTGMGLGGHTLMGGWRGAIYKEWTGLMNINIGSGLPLTPIDPIQLPGSSYTGIVRANYVGGGVHVFDPVKKTYLSQTAFVAPTSGFGTAGRNSIIGPSQFSISASMQRDFKLRDRYSMTARIDANNPFNNVRYGGWVNTIGPQFGAVTSANQMRYVTITLRLRH